MASAVMTVEVELWGLRLWIVQGVNRDLLTIPFACLSEEEALGVHEQLLEDYEHLNRFTAFVDEIVDFEDCSDNWKKVSGPAPDEIIFDEGAWLDFEDDDTGGF